MGRHNVCCEEKLWEPHLLLLVLVTIITIPIFLLLFLVLLFTLLLRLGLCLLILRNDVGAQLMRHIDHLLRTTRGTFVKDNTGFDFVLRLWQAAVGTKDKAFDVFVHQLLQDNIGVMTIHNGPIGFGIVGSLRTQLATEKLGMYTEIRTIAERGHVDGMQ